MARTDVARAVQFSIVVEALQNGPGVSYCEPGSRLFGIAALKVRDKSFAMLDWRGHLIVKLPKSRVDALVKGHAGQRVEASQGRPMTEWLEVRSESVEEWLQLAREALNFVRA